MSAFHQPQLLNKRQNRDDNFVAGIPLFNTFSRGSSRERERDQAVPTDLRQQPLNPHDALLACRSLPPAPLASHTTSHANAITLTPPTMCTRLHNIIRIPRRQLLSHRHKMSLSRLIRILPAKPHHLRTPAMRRRSRRAARPVATRLPDRWGSNSCVCYQ